MAHNAHSINDVATQSPCAGARSRHKKSTKGCTERRAQPSTHRSRRRRGGHAVAEGVDCLARSDPGA